MLFKHSSLAQQYLRNNLEEYRLISILIFNKLELIIKIDLISCTIKLYDIFSIHEKRFLINLFKKYFSVEKKLQIYFLGIVKEINKMDAKEIKNPIEFCCTAGNRSLQ